MAFKSFLGRTDLPRGFRNNNPGNLVKTSIPWNGEVAVNTDGKFEQFIELRYGIRALMRDIINDVNKGKTSVKALITEFAPAFENNMTAYIASVIANVGFSVIPELTQENLIAICKAIIFVENDHYNGKSGYSKMIVDADYYQAIAILGIALPKKKVTS